MAVGRHLVQRVLDWLKWGQVLVAEGGESSGRRSEGAEPAKRFVIVGGGPAVMSPPTGGAARPTTPSWRRIAWGTASTALHPF
jgi:hypothetical protein